MKLYTFWRSIATFRVRIALNLKGITPETETIDILSGDQHTGGYDAVNPQKLLPALVLDDGGAPLFQSMAIMEYLDEVHPLPRLLPSDPRGRARVRGLSQIAVSDAHPLSVPRVRNYLAQTLKLEPPQIAAWIHHWQIGSAARVREPSRERARDRPLLPWRQCYARRHLPGRSGRRRAIRQRRYLGLSHCGAHLRRLHGERRLRARASAAPARRAGEGLALIRPAPAPA